MPGGLLSILSYGCNDLYLTGAPQITFFKIVYRRHTNFSIESIQVGTNHMSNFGKEYEIIVPRIGDLVSKTYIKILLPEVYFSKQKIGGVLSTQNTPNKITSQEEYNTVLQFMIFNIQSYRSAYKNIKVVNITSKQILTDIFKCFTSTSKTTDDIVISGLDAENKYTKLSDKYTYTNYRDIYNMIYLSNIYKILLPYLQNNTIVNVNISPSDLYSLIQNAMEMSIKCQRYFWNQYNKYKLLNDSESTNNLKFAWNEHVGYNLIEYVDITLGGESIDRIYGEFLEVESQLTEHSTLKEIHSSLIGNTDILTRYDQNPKASTEAIHIPLKCWFTNNIGSAFPLIASQYSDLIIKIKFRSINECAYVENINGTIDIYGNPIEYSLEDLWNDSGYTFESSLLIDYIYLDGLERRKFAQSSHEYLIESIQTVQEILKNPEFELKASKNTLTFDSVMNQSMDYSIQLDLKHPCKELIWVLQKNIYTEDKDGILRCYFNKFAINTNSNENTIIDATITLNGYTKLNRKVGTAKYFNLIQPYQHHTTTPNPGIYVYSFSLAPEEIQPSGTCNFSRFSSQQLIQKIKEEAFYYALSDINVSITPQSVNDKILYSDIKVILFAKCYNVIRIHGGFSGLAFSFN